MEEKFIESFIDQLMSEDGNYENDIDMQNLLHEFESQDVSTNTRNFDDEIKKILDTNEDSPENCLKLNLKLQELLINLRDKLQNIRIKCNEKIQSNDKILKLTKVSFGHSKNDKEPFETNKNSNTTFHSTYVCGAPYFKDSNLFAAPHNPDYLKRKLCDNELFLLDLKFSQRNWTLDDKINVIRGIKNQIINYLRMKKEKISDENIKNYEDINLELKTMSELLPQVGNDFKINWLKISTVDLNSKHPENTCLTMWNMYLKPDLNRKSWTKAEDEKLVELVKKYNCENWAELSKETNNRSEYQCFVRYMADLAPKINLYNKWTKKEDKLLLHLIRKNTFGDCIRWPIVGMFFPNRTKTQIYQRYLHTLDPNIKKTKFTKEEDEILIKSLEKYGKFSCIPLSLFPGRNLLQLRNRYNNVLRHYNSAKPWTYEDDQKLLNLVAKYGTKDWCKISEKIVHHSRTSCRTRFSVITKFFEKHPNTDLKDIPRKKKNKKIVLNDDDNIIVNNKPNIKKIIKKEHYKDKLRPVQKELYEFFKLSYNFKYGADVCWQHINWDKTGKSLILLEVNLNSKKILNKKDLFFMKEFKTIRTYLKASESKRGKIHMIRSDYVLNPDWCTLTALRGISIKYCLKRKKKDKITNNDKKNKVKVESIDQTNMELVDQKEELLEKEKIELINQAKKKFRDRFFNIFHKTAFLILHNELIIT